MNAQAHPNDDLPARPGDVLAGKYRVDRVLGRGGMGVVVEAHHVALDERVALKFLLPDYATHPEAAARFLREARAAVKIKGEHVARVSDVGTLETGSPYMVMEFLEGIDLAAALQKYGVCQIPDAIDYLLQTCEAIAEAHGYGIIHRDLKPANLFLTRRPDGTPMIKVLDFGISKMSSGGVDNLTKTTAAMGSALYMSPEQMQTTRGVDHRTDIYALGISLYELLAGKQPFYADTLPQLCAEVLTGTPTPIRQLRVDVPEGLAVALEKAYARERDQRYQTIAELAAGLAPYAPQRSQNALDRVARLCGVQPATAGGAPRPPSHSQPNLSASGASPAASFAQSGGHPSAQSGGYPAAQSGGYPAAQSGGHPAAQTSPGALAQTGPGRVAAAQTGPSSPTSPAAQTGNLGAAIPINIPIDIGGYHGPMSEKAAAAFAAGGSTNTNLSRTGNLVRPAPSKTGVVVFLAVAGVLLAGLAIVFFVMRGGGEPSPAGDPTDAPSSSTTATAATTTSATAATTAEPGATSTASAATTAEPAPSASASASANATATAAATVKPKTSTVKPAGSTKRPGVMTSR